MREAPGWPAAVITVICIFILIVPCLHYYNDLIEMELISHGPLLEHSHKEDIICQEHSDLSALEPDESFERFVLPPAANAFGWVFSFPILNPQEQSTVLRC